VYIDPRPDECRTQKAGIYIGPDDMVMHATELMNESANERPAYLDIDIEYIPAAEAKAASFRTATTLWVDIDGLCSQDSQVEVTEDMMAAGSFERELEGGWKVPFDADILSVTGHLHDGGLKQEFTVNGEVVCEHVAKYGGSAGFITHVGMYGNEDQGSEEGHDHADGEGGEGDEHIHEEEEESEHTHEEGEEEGHTHDKRQGEEHIHDEGGEEGHTHEEGEEEHTHDEGKGEEHTHEEGEEEEHTHEEGEAHDHGSDAHITHISDITQCQEPVRLSAGDVLSLKSYYNLTLHPPMAGHHAGALEPVMGITFVYLLKDESE
jgi:hypothetical protein